MGNLTSVQPEATHEAFVKHVTTSFGYAMGTGDLSLEGYRRASVGGKVVSVGEEVMAVQDERADKIRKGMDEMKVCRRFGVSVCASWS